LLSRRRWLIIGALIVVALGIVGYLIFDRLFPADTQPAVTGVPTPAISSIDARRTAQAQTQTAEAAPSGSYLLPGSEGAVQLVAYIEDGLPYRLLQETPLYRSCTEDRVRATARPTATATLAAEGIGALDPTATPTETAPAQLPGAPDLIRLNVIGAESEACYQVGEIFPGFGEFRVAVGVTRSIVGEIEIDRANVANSLVGDIVININEFTSDEPRRDGAIRNDWLQSNRYPFARLLNAEVVGLPQRPYVEGETLTFQIVGLLEIREVQRETTFDVTATLTGDLLVVRAVTQILMTDFGFSPPSLAFVQADNEATLMLNLVARVEAN
jgi:polyisoprenoid-binding protein YceI